MYQSLLETKSAENGMARLVPTNIPTCSMIPFNTPAYFLYFCGQTSNERIKAASLIIKKEITCNKSISNSE